MKAQATFKVENFRTAGVEPNPPVVTALPVSVATMAKHYQGEISGVSATMFTAAFDHASTKGTYVAMESFEGSLHGKTGAFNFIHSASTNGGGRADEFFRIVDGSGTEDLTGISGTGGIAVDADGTHRLWLEYELKA
jgi:hypothetical protein